VKVKALSKVFALALAWCLLIQVASVMAADESTPKPAAGSIFKVVKTPNENFNNALFAASASSPNDIWAVGESTIHFDGTKWTAFPAPMIGQDLNALQGVVDISPTLAWAVGNVSVNFGSPTQVIEQWNGTQWSIFPGPTFAPNDQPLLFAATSTSANDVWAVGDLNLSDFNELKLLFEHFDGTSWIATTRPDPDDGFLFGASADATNDVWAVGYNGTTGTTAKGITEHFNGTTWKSVPSAIVDGGKGTNQLNAVAALAPNDVWAVGIFTPVVSPKQAATLTLIEHFDGTSWTVVPSPNVGPHSVSQNNTLLGITAVSAADIYAFGRVMAADGSGHQRTLVLHWNGTSWTIIPSPSPVKGTFRSDLLFAGVAPAPGNVWLFGDQNIVDTLALHTTTGDSLSKE
jgi:hypothetical protein